MKPLAERADSVDETIEQLRKAVKVIPLLQVFFQNRPAIRIGGFHGSGNYERSEEHTSELQSLMRISYAVFCLKKKKIKQLDNHKTSTSSNNAYLHRYSHI